MIRDEEARLYYKNNSRRCGDYLVTNYEDGICINRYYGTSNNVYIPETIDGKPVIKLSGYLELRDDTSKDESYEVVSAFSNIDNCVLYFPATLKYIDSETLVEYLGYINSDEERADSPHIIEIHVDEDNPYYWSHNGTLFTKDKKSLLFLNNSVSDYIVSENVENFAPINNIPYVSGTLTFGRNIRSIHAAILDEEGCNISMNYDESYYSDTISPLIIVKGYNGTVAEKWAQKYRLEFVPLDK